ncbi:MAG: PorT family protein [Cyclobacteriaceae bacterium]|nr:PorT family protein [Cyclobacteriaceae bacterium]
MKGLYEKKWQKAAEGAKIEPSAALWNNIASNLDIEKGRNYWATLLLIAATVTLAFSFPLTIGDSTFKLRQHSSQPVAQLDTVSNSNGGISLSFNTINVENKSTLDLGSESKKEVNNTQNHLTSSIKKPQHTLSAIRKNDNSDFCLIKEAKAQGVGFGLLNWDIDFQLANLDSYYIIPYFMPLKKPEDRNLLASLNMGTGSASTSGGLFSNTLLESDNGMSLSSSKDGFSNVVEQSESTGTTFYIGTGIELPMGNKWSVLTGIGYLAQKTEGVNNVVRNGKNGYRPLSIYAPVKKGSVFLSESYQYTLVNNYISIPISVKYPIINRKIKFRAGAGISTDFMLSHTVNSESYQKASYKPSEVDYNPIVLSGLVNFDVSYNINKHYSIALETGVRKGVTPIDKNKDLYPSLFTGGIVLLYKIQ